VSQISAGFRVAHIHDGVFFDGLKRLDDPLREFEEVTAANLK